MAVKKHPIIFGICITGLIALGFALVLTVIGFFFKDDSTFQFGDRIGVVHIRGVILESKGIVDQIKKFRKDESIKAIILRIDSPGGSTAASQEIHREVLRTIAKKKVLVSMGNVAASGGYYIATAANKIVANPGTLTGSIGVIMQFPNVKELINKIGVNLEVVKSGTFKDIGSPVREMKPEERLLLEEVIKNVQNQFVEVVIKGRKLSREQVEKIADGRIFSGEQAKGLGLVDELGSLEDTIEMTKKMVGLTGEVKIISQEKKKFSLWDLLSSDLFGELKQNIQEIWPAPPLLFITPAFYKN